MKPTHNKSIGRLGGKSSRKGAALVEFAVCLPVILLVVFGSIQAASMLFLRQTAIQSAYEGVKVAVRGDGTDALAREVAQQVIDGRRLTGVTIDINPSNVADLEPGTVIDVTVSAPSDENTLFPFGVFTGKTIVANAVMIKE
jgi:Flp pilus assembly protein TadG